MYARTAASLRSRAPFEPLGLGQADEPVELRRVVVDGLAEVDAGVSPLGQPGVAHDHEDDQMVGVDQPVERPGRELEVAPGRELDRAEAVLEVVELYGSPSADHVVAFVGDGVDVGRAGHQPVGRGALVIDGELGQADAADQVLRAGLRRRRPSRRRAPAPGRRPGTVQAARSSMPSDSSGASVPPHTAPFVPKPRYGVKPTAGSGFGGATIRSASERLGDALLGNIRMILEIKKV